LKEFRFEIESWPCVHERKIYVPTLHGGGGCYLEGVRSLPICVRSKPILPILRQWILAASSRLTL